MRAAARVSCRLAILALGASPGAGHAEDLRAALAAAYAANPTLAAARETLRATDEGVAIARADGLPSASASVSETENLVQSQLSLGDAPRALALAGTLSVPVYSGGAVRNGMKAADRRVLAGRADLAGSESGLFAQVVAAYMDVRLGEETLRLNRA
ncbi:MAG TPA: TolC family protein, partial [Novosphingobium sp.]|nr:TolC family protein [Novosphingobium sp.]